MLSTLSIDLDWTFDYSPEGICLFESDIRVSVEVRGIYGSSEIVDWRIESVGVERWEHPSRRGTVHWLPDDCEGVKLIVASLKADKKFDRAVREQALIEAEAA